MAVKRRRRIDMPDAVSAIRGQVADLTSSLGYLNDSLEGLAQQIGRFGSLTREVTGVQPVHIPLGPMAMQHPGPHHSGGLSSVARGSSLVLSPEEQAKKAALLAQFDDKARMREELEADMEAGA
jgi:hypothetical protein